MYCSIFVLMTNYYIYNSVLVVIGRGGEMITKLQADAGAKIQVAPGMLQLHPV